MKNNHLLLLLMPFLIIGCSNPVKWDVQTTYEIHGLGNATKIKRELRRTLKGATDPYGFVEDFNGELYQFTLNDISDMAELTKVQGIIRQVTTSNNIPVDLTKASFVYQSIDGSAHSRIEVRGRATKGSTVYLDTGEANADIIRNIGASGTWQKSIKPNRKLRDRGGFIYGLVKKGSTKLFIKINVLDPTVLDTISEEELPADSILREFAG